ncbi:hypothetical protein TrispH2_006502 [Trichoplax sp. H2]|nr:hypothetical protein TrispH2_006502 [Trichoplax sp. H2]|eukprot:RDD41328.1 hypothetical protein TrispH2_006502 [Trichoplax sp. H2]
MAADTTDAIVSFAIKNVDEDRCKDSDEGITTDDQIMEDVNARRWKLTKSNIKEHWNRVLTVLNGKNLIEKWLTSITSNETVMSTLQESREASESALKLAIEDKDNQLLASSRRFAQAFRSDRDVHQVVSLIKEIEEDQTVRELFQKCQKQFKDVSELNDQELEEITELLRQLEASDIFKLLKEKVERIIDKYFDKQVFQDGVTVVRSIKESEELAEILRQGKSILSREDSQNNIHEVVRLGEQLIDKVRNTDAGANLLKKQDAAYSSVTAFVKDSPLKSPIEALKKNVNFLEEVKMVFIPWIKDQLLSLRLPTLTGNKSTKFGDVDYELSNIVLSELRLPVDCLDISWDHELIINVNNIEAALNNFEWKYRKSTFPRLRDALDVFLSLNNLYSDLITICASTISLAVTNNLADIKNVAATFETLKIVTSGTGARYVITSDFFSGCIMLLSLGLAKVLRQKAIQKRLQEVLNKHVSTLVSSINHLITAYVNKVALIKDKLSRQRNLGDTNRSISESALHRPNFHLNIPSPQVANSSSHTNFQNSHSTSALNESPLADDKY